MGLRVMQDDDYFQYFQPMVSGFDLRRSEWAAVPTIDSTWRALAVIAVPLMKDAILDRKVPLDDPTQAYPLTPDWNRAMQLGVAEELMRAGPIRDGEVLAEFDV